jgi:hypothetical protein
MSLEAPICTLLGSVEEYGVCQRTLQVCGGRQAPRVQPFVGGAIGLLPAILVFVLGSSDLFLWRQVASVVFSVTRNLCTLAFQDCHICMHRM